MRTGVLLVNLGTPDSPAVADVRKYLREFLMDGRVIDVPYLNRLFLVHGIIAPFRAVSSAKAYAQLWTQDGSPLKTYGYQLERLLQRELGDQYVVSLAMRYQRPSIRESLLKIKNTQVGRIIVVPLYPQYASASTGSTHEAVMKEVSAWEVIPEIQFISKFFDHPQFIDAWAQVGHNYLRQQAYDHIIFSYHGLPERQIKKASRQNYCQANDVCCQKYHQLNEYCYRAQCYETTRLLATALSLEHSRYTVCFQSRLGKEPWIKPYTDEVIRRFAVEGVKRLLVFSPAFVADCLETTVEIGIEYRHLFKKLGGEELTLVESLNTHPDWVNCLKSLITSPQQAAQPVYI